MSAPEAVKTGMMPSSFHCISPAPSTSLSNPRISGMPKSGTVPCHTKPRSVCVTCSARNRNHRPTLISPCIRSRTADARTVPGAMACSRYRRARSGRLAMRPASNTSVAREAPLNRSSSIISSWLKQVVRASTPLAANDGTCLRCRNATTVPRANAETVPVFRRLASALPENRHSHAIH